MQGADMQGADMQGADMQERIGFIGLGIMGHPMASHILQAGYPLTVWNRTASKSHALIQAGAHAALHPAALAQCSDVIILCVASSSDVEEVLDGPQGVLQGAQPGSLVIDCSTISPQTTRALAQRLQQHQVAMLDAPVSGGSEGAHAAALSFMIGGDAADVKRAEPILRTMGPTLTHVGDHGSGQMVKLVNQILVAGHTLAMSEALLFAQRAGVDLPKALEAIHAGAASSWIWRHRAPCVLAKDWQASFTIDMQQKDLSLVLEEGQCQATPLVMTSLIQQLYRSLQARGLGDQGNQALYLALEPSSSL